MAAWTVTISASSLLCSIQRTKVDKLSEKSVHLVASVILAAACAQGRDPSISIDHSEYFETETCLQCASLR